MKYACQKCNALLDDLIKSEADKLEIWAFKAKEFKLFGIHKIQEDYNYSLLDSKILMSHINLFFGTCHSCDYDNLTEENTICPKCNSFNYNWKINLSFTKAFAEILAFKLCGLLDGINDDQVSGFWCDGVNYVAENSREISKENISSKKEIVTNIDCGKSGQEHFELTIFLGAKSFQNYMLGKSIVDQIPSETKNNNLSVDVASKTLRLILD